MMENVNLLFRSVACGLGEEIVHMGKASFDALICSEKNLTGAHFARAAQFQPIDYMRYAEFAAMHLWTREMEGGDVLDVSSPLWFSLWWAHRIRDLRLRYINIVPAEWLPFSQIAESLGVENIRYETQDVRQLTFADESFDRVMAISSLEHVDPETGGDDAALTEIRRVLRPEGRLLLTVPCKDKANVVYADGPVYERTGPERKFFAREYDRDSFLAWVERNGFEVEEILYICERKGLGAWDYYTWGPGKEAPWASRFKRIKTWVERRRGRSLEGFLAGRYLYLSTQPAPRLVNVAAVLKKR